MLTNIIKIVNNDEQLYDGDLWYYFWLAFSNGNVRNPFHNFGHGVEATQIAYLLMVLMNYSGRFGKRLARLLLISILFHDAQHLNTTANDAEQVSAAIEFTKKHILIEDRPYLATIMTFQRATQFPHIKGFENGHLESVAEGIQIIRDADMGQNFENEWMQKTLMGLSVEMGLTPLQMLHEQKNFIKPEMFYTKAARQLYLPRIEERLSDVNLMIEKFKEVHKLCKTR